MNESIEKFNIKPLQFDEDDLNIIKLSTNNSLSTSGNPSDGPPHKIINTHKISSKTPVNHRHQPSLKDTLVIHPIGSDPGTSTTTTTTTTTTKKETTVTLSPKLKGLSNSESLPRKSTIAKNIQGFLKDVDDDSMFNLRNSLEKQEFQRELSQDVTVVPEYPNTVIEKDAKVTPLKKKKDKTSKTPHHHCKPIFPIESNNIFNYEKPKISYKTRDFIVNLKEVYKDIKMILEKNDQSLKKLFSKLYLTLKELHNEGNLQILIDDITLITEIIIRSGYFIQIFRYFFRVINEVKNTEVFFEFLGECKKMVEIINLIIKSRGNESQTRQIITIENDQRKILIKQMKYLIQIMLKNEDLISLVQNISFLKKQVDIAKEEQKKAFPFNNIKQSLKYAPLTNEIISALQTLIGERPNLRIFFRNLSEAFDYIKNNKAYIHVMREFTDIIRTIYRNDEPQLNEEQEIRVRNGMDKLEIMVLEICSLPLIDEARVQLSQLFSRTSQDKMNLKFASDVKALINGIKADVNSQSRINFTILHDLKHLVIPYIIKNIHVITLPTITNMNDPERDKKLDYRFENIEVEITRLDPEAIKVGVVGSIETIPLKLKGSIKSIISLEITNIHLKMNNVKWTIIKKSFPKIKDSGLLNISTANEGISIRLKLSFSHSILESHHLCNIYKLKCKIDKLDVNISMSKHNSLYKKVYKLFKKKITNIIERSIEDQIREKITQLEVKLYNLFFVEDKDKQVIKELKAQNKIKRQKILERIMMEIPHSEKISRRFLNNYEILDGRPLQTINAAKINAANGLTPPSTVSSSRRASKDSQDIDEFIKAHYKPQTENNTGKFIPSPSIPAPYSLINTHTEHHQSPNYLKRRSSQPELSSSYKYPFAPNASLINSKPLYRDTIDE